MQDAMLERDDLDSLLDKHGVSGVSIAVLCPDGSGDASVSTQCAGIADPNATPLFDSTLLQIASLSKPIASTFAAGYFADAGVCRGGSKMTRLRFHLRLPLRKGLRFQVSGFKG